MANDLSFDIKQKVVIQKPSIRYVPEELLNTATIFRAFWDIFLASFMAAFGASLSLDRPLSTMHKAFLWMTGIAALAFLALDIYWNWRARHEG